MTPSHDRRSCRVTQDVLNEIDGPMLQHGLQGFHGPPLLIRTPAALKPDQRLLEERYSVFRRAYV